MLQTKHDIALAPDTNIKKGLMGADIGVCTAQRGRLTVQSRVTITKKVRKRGTYSKSLQDSLSNTATANCSYNLVLNVKGTASQSLFLNTETNQAGLAKWHNL